jgi:microcystin-dependent protein
MADPYVGEIRLFAGNFAPVGWAFCDGSIQAIAQNDVLFALIGTTYGGDGQNTFALPDLRCRVPIHQGQGSGLSSRVIGELAGTASVTLTIAQLPAHSHALRASLATGAAAPTGGVLAGNSVSVYGTGSPSAPMAPQGIAASGNSQPHNNMAPYLGINYIISLFGIFPSQN